MVTVKVTAANPAYLEEIWPSAWPILKSAVEQSFGVDSEESVFQDLKEEYRYMLLATVDGKLKGVAVVGFRESEKRMADVHYVGGKNLKDWQREMDKAIEIVARTEGCSTITALGRVGWGKIWKDYRNTDKMLFVKEVKYG